MSNRLLLFLLSVATATALIACGSSGEGMDEDSPTRAASVASRVPESTAIRPASTPVPTPTPALKHPNMVLELGEGDFWEFRWAWSEGSCAQGRSCRTAEHGGVFSISLGEPRTIGGIEMFALDITGAHIADDGAVDFAPDWRFIGIDGPRLVASTGSNTVTIFDASDGEWTGGGFFSRFSDNETHVASAGSISTSQPFAAWNGVRTGPVVTVVRSDSQSMCDIIEGRRICPNDSSFSLSEVQYYRDKVGPFGYTYRFSASFSGGGFFSSNSSEESVALIASSLRGDVLAPTPTPAPSPTPIPDLNVEFGPVDGTLILAAPDDQIPDFKTGVNLDVGVVDVTFTNPDVGAGDWSYGITFRHSGEETFHAVYVTSNEQWVHFARGGSVESQVDVGQGSVDLNLGVGRENRLTVLFDGSIGGLWVNGELVAELDLSLSSALVAGDVRVIAGIVGSDTYNGAESNFYDLTIATE